MGCGCGLYRNDDCNVSSVGGLTVVALWLLTLWKPWFQDFLEMELTVVVLWQWSLWKPWFKASCARLLKPWFQCLLGRGFTIVVVWLLVL